METTYSKEDDKKVRVTKIIPSVEEVDILDISDVKRQLNDNIDSRAKCQAEYDRQLQAFDQKIAELNVIITEAEKVGVTDEEPV